MADEKLCSRCHEIKPIDAFYRRKVDGGAYRGPCKDCVLISMRDPVIRQRVAANKRRGILALYGMSDVDYAKMLVDQNGKCAICDKEETSIHSLTGTMFSLSIDHDHTTGKVRGLLCNRCNRAIGMLGDDVDTLLKAVDYLTIRKDI